MIAATVTQAVPLRVRVDGAASDSPATLAGGTTPALNARVYVFPNTSPPLVQAGVALGAYATVAALTAEQDRAMAAEAALAAGAPPFATIFKLGVDA